MLHCVIVSSLICVEMREYCTECDKYIWFFWYCYIRIFNRIVFLRRKYLDIHLYQNHTLAEYYFPYEYSFVYYLYSFISYEYNQLFVHIIFLIQIYSDIRLYQNQYECHTMVWWFVWLAFSSIGSVMHSIQSDTFELVWVKRLSRVKCRYRPTW